MRFICMFLIVILSLQYGCVSSSTSNSDDIRNKPLEYKLAYLDNVGRVKDDDVKVARFRYLLNTLSEKTGETKESIGDDTVRATEVLRTKYGKDIKNLELMEQAHDYFKSGPKATYREVAKLLVLLMAE